MQRRRWLQLLVFLAVLVIVYWLARFDPHSWMHRTSALGAIKPAGRQPGVVSSSAPRLPASHVNIPLTAREPATFNHRLRCTQYRALFGHEESPEILSLLCDRKPLDALKILIPLAEKGDEHATRVVGMLGHFGGSCDVLQPSATFERYKMSLLKRAYENGAASHIQQRLNDILTEEQRGPTAEELEACRQSGIEFKKLFPGMIAQFASTLGRSVRTLLGENEADVQIEYDRKMLVPGDADGELKLAMELLQKGTTESQSEALTLLQEAAAASPAAKTQLAMFLLKGGSIAAPDPTRANELLTQAALAGDAVALRILAGPSDPGYPDLDPALPAPERYAWGVFQQRLNEEGCFGSSQYVSWAAFSSTTPNLLSMSPADSVAAETRAAGLLGAPLVEARKFLGCD